MNVRMIIVFHIKVGGLYYFWAVSGIHNGYPGYALFLSYILDTVFSSLFRSVVFVACVVFV